MGHDHHHHSGAHSHAPSAHADRRLLALALLLIVCFMCVEIAAGLIVNSVALLSDAGHMLTDAAALALALGAAHIAPRAAPAALTFGWGRVEILAAQINGATLLILGAVIVSEAVRRLANPPEVDGGLVLLVGVAGAAVNVAAAGILARAERRSLNVEGARAHLLADLYGSLGAVAAGGAVLLFEFQAADGIAGLVVAGLVLRSGWSLTRSSSRVLLEASPSGTDPVEIGSALAASPGVREVHDLHLWEITSDFPALSAHVLVDVDEDCHRKRRALEQLLHERFAIDHVTLQVDHATSGRTTQLACAVRCCS
jgi:cobalt-zinc-cadmium efflux system protein